jgi:hypothetical protein
MTGDKFRVTHVISLTCHCISFSTSDTSITLTASLHFGTPEEHSFPMECCVFLAALCCRGSCSAFCVVDTLDLSNVCVDGYDRNGSRRWMMHFCCMPIQMMLRTILRYDLWDQGVRSLLNDQSNGIEWFGAIIGLHQTIGKHKTLH